MILTMCLTSYRSETGETNHLLLRACPWKPIHGLQFLEFQLTHEEP